MTSPLPVSNATLGTVSDPPPSPLGDLAILAGSANPVFARRIADSLGVRLTPCEAQIFSEGNVFVRILENVRGRDTFVIQGVHRPVNDNFVELLFWIDALKRASASIVTDSLPGLRLSWELVRVPGGEVTVQSANGAERVTVDSFLIGRTEVPWELYDVFYLRLDVARESRAGVDAASRPSRPYGAPDRGFGHRGYAAISLTHGAAVRFATWLSAKTNQRYAVASDAQWQRAADLAFGAAGAPTVSAAAWSADNASATPHPIAQRAPDALGLFDLLGNVGEWVTAADGSPWLRGGSFAMRLSALSVATRERQQPSWNVTDPQDPKSRWWLSDGPFAGFRLVRIP